MTSNTPPQPERSTSSSIEDLDTLNTLPEHQRIEIEAAAFRRLLEHLQDRSDVQNIDLMNLAGFCRNCLSKWYQSAALERGVDVDKLIARERVYGMSYEEWKSNYQK